MTIIILLGAFNHLRPRIPGWLGSSHCCWTLCLGLLALMVVVVVIMVVEFMLFSDKITGHDGDGNEKDVQPAVEVLELGC